MRFRGFLDGVGQGLVFSALACVFVLLAFIQDGAIRVDDVSLPVEGVLAFYIFSGVFIGGFAGACRSFVTSYARAAAVGFGAAMPVIAVAWAVVGIDDGLGDYVRAVAFLSLSAGATGGCVLYSVKLRHLNRRIEKS